jgi:hypothetical protein
MVNVYEPLINVVRNNKPKRLTRLEPKGKRSSIEVCKLFYRRCRIFGKQTEPNPLNHVIMRNVVSLYFSLSGKQSAMIAYRNAGKGCQKKQTPTCNEVDRSNLQSERMQTSDWSEITKSSEKRR